MPAIESASVVAEAEVVLPGRHLLGDRESTELEANGAAHGVGGDDVAGEIANDDAEGIALHPNIERRGMEAHRSVVLRRLNVDRFTACTGEDCPGGVLGERSW